MGGGLELQEEGLQEVQQGSTRVVQGLGECHSSLGGFRGCLLFDSWEALCDCCEILEDFGLLLLILGGLWMTDATSWGDGDGGLDLVLLQPTPRLSVIVAGIVPFVFFRVYLICAVCQRLRNVDEVTAP